MGEAVPQLQLAVDRGCTRLFLGWFARQPYPAAVHRQGRNAAQSMERAPADPDETQPRRAAWDELDVHHLADPDGGGLCALLRAPAAAATTVPELSDIRSKAPSARRDLREQEQQSGLQQILRRGHTIPVRVGQYEPHMHSVYAELRQRRGSAAPPAARAAGSFEAGGRWVRNVRVQGVEVGLTRGRLPAGPAIPRENFGMGWLWQLDMDGGWLCCG